MKFSRYSINNDTYKKLLVEYESEFNYNADKVLKKYSFIKSDLSPQVLGTEQKNIFTIYTFPAKW